MPKAVAIDFDGVLHGYSKGWQGGEIYDPPVLGAAAAMQHLLDEGYEVVIFTTRAFDRVVNGVEQKNQIAEVEAYLKQHGIAYTRIHTEPNKPLCRLFVDDNAYRFTPQWGWDQTQLDMVKQYAERK